MNKREFNLAQMDRILVLGSGGAGKSTFAKQLGELLSIKVDHLDRHYWKPGWVKPSNDEWVATVANLIGREKWIIDGNFGGTLDQRIARCDTLIFLDMPRLLCLWRIVKRRLTYLRAPRPDMAEGCEEKLDLEFVSWVWNYSKRTRPRILRLMHHNAEQKRMVRLTSDSEVRQFLNALRQNQYGGVDNARSCEADDQGCETR
jgi:adenylate kinase family enzyme